MKQALILLVTLLVGLPLYFYIDDPLFWQRYSAIAKAQWFGIPRAQGYSPLASVAGGSSEPLPRQLVAVAGSDTGIPIGALDQVEEYVDERNTSSFIVWHNGQVVRERYFGDFHPHSLIVSKSMAKPLSSMVVARAFEQGYLHSLDQSAADFIEEWQGTEKAAITIRHILNMSSGLLRFYRDTLNPFTYFHQGFLSGKHENIIVDKVPLQEPPGTYYDYSQITSDLVAVLIARATGQSYQDYLSEQLLRPMGAAGGNIWLNREGGVAHSGCCIMLPAETWLRLGILMVEDGVWQGRRLLPDWWRDEIYKGSDANPNYGLYFWLGSPFVERRHVVDPNHIANPGTLQSEPYAADDLFMFDGNGNQVLYMIPSRQLVIMRTGGWPGKDDQGREWDNTYVPNVIIHALDQQVEAAMPARQSDAVNKESIP